MRHLRPHRRTCRVPARAPQRGLTLVELMVALTIAALLLVSAAPYFSDYIGNSRLREGGNLLLSEALMAQNEAVKRNNRVRLVTDGTSIQVQDFSTGAAVVLRTRVLTGNVYAPQATVEFTGDGRLSTWPTAARIDLSATSIVCSDEMRCPALVIEAGGAVRLCGNQLSCS